MHQAGRSNRQAESVADPGDWTNLAELIAEFPSGLLGFLREFAQRHADLCFGFESGWSRQVESALRNEITYDLLDDPLPIDHDQIYSDIWHL